MYEDKIIPVPNPVDPVAAPESAPIVSGENFVDPTHKIPIIPPALSGVMQAIKPPVHFLDGTEGVETPGKIGDGSSVVIDFPDGFSSEEQIEKALSRRSVKEWQRPAAGVYDRQKGVEALRQRQLK